MRRSSYPAKFENHEFAIRSSLPNLKVSWQITGVRQDAFAKANPLIVEEEKDARQKGFYIHPEFYGAPAEKQIEWARHPQMMKQLQKHRQQAGGKSASSHRDSEALARCAAMPANRFATWPETVGSGGTRPRTGDHNDEDSDIYIYIYIYILALLLAALMAPFYLRAQVSSAQPTAVVPRLVNFSGKAVDEQGKVIAGIAGITLSIYKDQSGGVPLWIETQNVETNAKGVYTLQLGSTKPEGLPLDLFLSGEARWLGVRINSDEEQPRVLLLSVPYALKAADAETLGGKPASAFMLGGADSLESCRSILCNRRFADRALAASIRDRLRNPEFRSPLDGRQRAGQLDSLPIRLWNYGQGGPEHFNAGLHARRERCRDDSRLTDSAGHGRRHFDQGRELAAFRLTASSFNSSSSAAVSEFFNWQAEASGNNTASPSATLNLLFGSGSGTGSETGLQIAKNGVITFAAGQTFPGKGNRHRNQRGIERTDFGLHREWHSSNEKRNACLELDAGSLPPVRTRQCHREAR